MQICGRRLSLCETYVLRTMEGQIEKTKVRRTKSNKDSGIRSIKKDEWLRRRKRSKL